MNFTLSEKKKIALLLDAFANKSLRNGKIEYDYEDKPCQNLVQNLYNIPEIKKIYDGDILMYGIEKAITKRFQSTPVRFREDDIKEIIEEVITTLKHNLADHIIIVPIQSAQFESLIKIDNLTFIPQDYLREDKLKIIAKSAKKTFEETVWIAEHTEKSRSKDFLKYPLLLIKQTQQTSTVHYNSLNIAKIIIYSIRCFYFGNIHKTSKGKIHLLSLAQRSLKKASHLAIYSKENWRENHKPLNFDVSIPFDLNWLEDKEMSKKFKNFLKCIYFEENLDDFNVCFLNALILFNESIKQNNSISTIITITIAESILTRNRNEKRLRICAILPRLMSLPKNQQKKVAREFDELYQKRNNFVHSGESVSINYDFETSEPTILEKARKIIAQLILNYPTFENIIDKKMITNNGVSKQSMRMKYWDNYVDSIFHDIIY